ncbi:MAG: hypothetical protein N2691_03020 [Patescibacteria group bacterium]|nr:hypothetical protein [Patescibacteria group bacterium]
MPSLNYFIRVGMGFAVFFLLCTGIIFIDGFVYAQANVSYSVANYVLIADENPQDGSIVSAVNNKFRISNIPYDQNIVGVVTSRPAISFIDSDTGGKTPIVSSGNAYVLASTRNGVIKQGDALTSSEIPGVAVKADRPGNIIGTALEDFESTNPEEIKKLFITVDIRFWSEEVGDRSVFDLFKLSLLTAASEQPPIFFKYTTASFSVLGAILLGFYFFGKVAAKGVEAIGRNPLAGRMIQLGIIFNVFLTVVTIAAGLVIAIVILRL